MTRRLHVRALLVAIAGIVAGCVVSERRSEGSVLRPGGVDLSFDVSGGTCWDPGRGFFTFANVAVEGTSMQITTMLQALIDPSTYALSTMLMPTLTGTWRDERFEIAGQLTADLGSGCAIAVDLSATGSPGVDGSPNGDFAWSLGVQPATVDCETRASFAALSASLSAGGACTATATALGSPE